MKTTLRLQVSSTSEAREARRHFRALGCKVMFRAWGTWGGSDLLFASDTPVDIPARGEGVLYEGDRQTWMVGSELVLFAESADIRVSHS